MNNAAMISWLFGQLGIVPEAVQRSRLLAQLQRGKRTGRSEAEFRPSQAAAKIHANNPRVVSSLTLIRRFRQVKFLLGGLHAVAKFVDYRDGRVHTIAPRYVGDRSDQQHGPEFAGDRQASGHRGRADRQPQPLMASEGFELVASTSSTPTSSLRQTPLPASRVRHMNTSIRCETSAVSTLTHTSACISPNSRHTAILHTEFRGARANQFSCHPCPVHLGKSCGKPVTRTLRWRACSRVWAKWREVSAKNRQDGHLKHGKLDHATRPGATSGVRRRSAGMAKAKDLIEAFWHHLSSGRRIHRVDAVAGRV